MTGPTRHGNDPLSSGHDPTLVGAYLLGTLSPADQAAFEGHLPECDECRQELDELIDLPPLLDRVDLADLEGGPVADENLFARVAAAVEADRADHRRRRRVRLTLTGAAAGLVIAGGTAAGLVATAGTAAPPSFAASSGPVHLTVQLASQPVGTGLDVTVRGAPTDAHCRLLAVSRSGRTEVAGSWTASYSGTAHVSGLATSFRPSQLAEVVLQIAGTGRRVTVHTT